MASGLMGAALGDLSDLYRSGTAVGLSDAQLLARYAATRDEPAFAALVSRHGPMVLATCRAVLRHEQDVEDAFQATFLVLARKAGSIRAGAALGGWLHRVAYRVAVQASREAQRRRRRESEVSAMEISAVTGAGPALELRSIVHEEIERLPERHRLPVVLCDLEGLTYQQAAARLAWTEPTLRHRLSQARQRLRERLTHRGVTGAALGAAAAPAVVPAAWARAAVAAATGGAASAAAMALAQSIIRGMLRTQLKLAATAALAAAALVSVGVLAVAAGRPEDPKSRQTTPAVAEAPSAARGTAAPAPAPVGMTEVRGRVVGLDGQPVPGAAVRTAHADPEGRAEAASGPDGRFLLRIPRSVRNSNVGLNGYDEFPWVVATAPGFGPGWVRGALKAAASGEVTVRLAEDGPPIEGRIVDLEGRPVAEARIQATRLYFAEGGDLTPWLTQAKDRGARGPGDGLNELPMTVATTKTGPDGRFQLAGLGRERVALLSISGPTIATTEVYAMNREGADVRLMSQEMGQSTPLFIHARRLEHAAAPTKPVQGVVRDKDTGRPLAGLTLHAAVYRARFLGPTDGIEATTDAEGRYRLSGLPKAPAYQLAVEQAQGKPYPRVSFRVPATSPAFEPVTFDLALKRGILIRGRVTDKATGQPVPGFLNAFTFRNNPAIREFPGYGAYNNLAYIPIQDDGRYEVVGLPGRNVIACRSEMRRYRGPVGADRIPGYDPQRMAFDTLPLNCYANQYHVLAEVDIDPEAESATLDIQVDPGRTVTVTVDDPDGRPLGGTKVAGLTDLFPGAFEYEQESPIFEVHGLDPPKPRRVTITHAGRKLIGTAYLRGDEAGPQTVRLQPWATITGRVVDDDGQPHRGLSILSIDGIFPKRPDVQGILPGEVRIGRDGRFHVERLVPGLRYGALATDNARLYGELFRDLAAAPGEVKDLGDLRLIPPKRDGRS
jgi:RNA polymerase sigma factor (sigma-70 family)